tara:strand:- start:9 stop:578 length:570 start_codon:yes stop_codon:yes gene_type:complete
MLKPAYYLLLFTYLISIIFLFSLNYINVLFFKEEIIIVPEIKSNDEKTFLVPNQIEKDDYNFKILNHAKDEFSETKDKTITYNTNNTNSNKDKLINNLIKKSNVEKINFQFVVQLGVFKNKNNAISKISDLKKKSIKILKDVKLKIVEKNKDKNIFYNVETNLISKKNAINLCNEFKDKKINCIIKVKK